MKQHCRAGLGEVNAGILGIAGGQFGMSGEIRKRKRPVGGLVEFIKLAVLMPVGRKHILDVETGEVRVSLSLFHPFEWIFFAFGLGFQFAHWQGVRMLAHFHTDQIIRPPHAFTASAFVAGRLYWGGGF